MTEVLLAEARVGAGAHRLAVLKRMWADLARDSELSALFLNEARQAARLNHPQIVQTYELLDDARRPTVALEYVDGQPLSRILNRLVGPNSLTLSLRLHIISQVLTALEYAHDLTDYDGSPRGVIHGDVTPQNVFITYTGQVKLLNFRVPASGNPEGGVYFGRGDGQAAYMAPEQLAGLPVDGRADLFAVGVMLWEMAAGRRLWQGMPDSAIIRHLSSRIPIPPFNRAAQLPLGLESICARALSRDPASRYSDAADFASHIASVDTGGEHARAGRLGNVVSQAFHQEREARRALIEANLGRSALANGNFEQAAATPVRAANATPGSPSESQDGGGEWDDHEGDDATNPVMLLDPSLIISISTDNAPGDVSPVPSAPPRVRPVPPPLPKIATLAPRVQSTDATATNQVRHSQRSRLQWAGGGILLVAGLLLVASGRLWPASHAGAKAAATVSVARTSPTVRAAAEPPATSPPSITPIVTRIMASVPAVEDVESPGAPRASVDADRVSRRERRARRHVRREYRDADNFEPVPMDSQEQVTDDDILEPSFDLSAADASAPPSFDPKTIPSVPAAGGRRLASRPIDTSDPFQP